MKMNNIGYLVKEGIRGIFLHSFASIAAICVTVACLLIVGSVIGLSYNLGVIVQEQNKTNEVMVYIDEDYTDAEARSVGTRLNQIENVFKVTFVSREEALEDFIADQGGGDAFAGVDANPLRHRFVVQLEGTGQIEETVAQLERVPGVAKVRAAYDLAEGFTTLQNILGAASVLAIVALLAISLLIIANTVKLAMYDRRDEIAIMKMVGATNSFIRLPYVVEGFILGIVGAGLAFGLMWLGYDLLYVRIRELDTLNMLKDMVPFIKLLPLMLPAFVGAGLFVGIMGSGTSIKRFMNV